MPINVTGRYVEGDDTSEILHGSNWGHDNIIGNGGGDALFGYDGNDRLNGGIDGQEDFLYGGSGSDTAEYTTDVDMTIDLSEGTAHTNGGFFTANTPFGPIYYYIPSVLEDSFVSIENIKAGDGDDTIIGNEFKNTLDGGGGNDVISSGLGADTMIGGAGADKFVANSAAEINKDYIADFVRGGKYGDTIDLSAIDANEKMRGDQAFEIADYGFTGNAGELARIGYNSGFSQTWGGDTDGDGIADFTFTVNIAGGWGNLDEGDFIL